MWFDKIRQVKKKPAKNTSIFSEKTEATEENIRSMMELEKKRGVKISNIKYTAPTGEELVFDSAQDLYNYINKSDELDFGSIKDKPEQPTTVYGNSKKRNTKQCPHCDHVFDEPPTRGRKCPKCGNSFYVRVGNRLFASDLLSFEQTTASDCFRDMSNFGVNVEYAAKLRVSLTKKWGKEPSLDDLIWGIAKNFPITLKANPMKTIDAAADLYFQLARYEDARGRDPRKALEAHIRQNISQCECHMRAEKMSSDYLYIMSKYCCEACRERNGKKVKIADAKTKMPIPFKDCQNKTTPKSKYSFCRSYYTWFDPRS